MASKPVKSPLRRFWIALCLGALPGVLVGVMVKGYMDKGSIWGGGLTNLPQRERTVIRRMDPDDTPVEILEGPSLRYIQAVQGGEWDTVVGMTQWMQERLAQTIEEAGDTAKATTMQDLQEQLSLDQASPAQLQVQGVEDVGVLRESAKVEYLMSDGGLQDLALEVKRRDWFRVTYPVRSQALLDDKGLPLRAVTVGVNISADDLILKSNVIGNLEIDLGTLSANWENG